jgi:sulfur carrier protein
MEITLNGHPHQLPEEITAATLIEQLQLSAKRVAVEINEEIVPRSTYTGVWLKPGDRVEIVQAIGGG